MNNSILLIGNGPSILNNEIGNIIDSHNLICRFNAFKIDGYEKYTGIKTDIWVTCLIDNVIKQNYNKYKFVYFPLQQKRYLELEKIIPNSKCFPHSIYTKASMLNGKYFYPSSGLLACIYFIENGYDVIIHGFDHFQSQKHHYCDNLDVGPNHSPNMELQAFNTLILNNKVKVL